MQSSQRSKEPDNYTCLITICEVAKQKTYDLIVIGSRGTNRSTLEKLMGSVAAGVVSKADCPVLLIPDEANFGSIRTLTYATGIEGADPFEIWKGLKLLEPFAPKLCLLHVAAKKEMSTARKLNELKFFLRKIFLIRRLQLKRYKAKR